MTKFRQNAKGKILGLLTGDWLLSEVEVLTSDFRSKAYSSTATATGSSVGDSGATGLTFFNLRVI